MPHLPHALPHSYEASSSAQTIAGEAPTGRFAVLHRLRAVPSGRDAGPRAARVLIADGQALVRAGFRLLLEADRHITVVGEAATGEQAVALARRARPDVGLLDARMPGPDSVEATRRISAGAGPAGSLLTP